LFNHLLQPWWCDEKRSEYLPYYAPSELGIPSLSRHSRSCQTNTWVNVWMWTGSFFETHPAMDADNGKVRWVIFIPWRPHSMLVGHRIHPRFRRKNVYPIRINLVLQ
jgi:hypothetical protein